MFPMSPPLPQWFHVSVQGVHSPNPSLQFGGLFFPLPFTPKDAQAPHFLQTSAPLLELSHIVQRPGWVLQAPQPTVPRVGSHQRSQGEMAVSSPPLSPPLFQPAGSAEAPNLQFTPFQLPSFPQGQGSNQNDSLDKLPWHPHALSLTRFFGWLASSLLWSAALDLSLLPGWAPAAPPPPVPLHFILLSGSAHLVSQWPFDVSPSRGLSLGFIPFPPLDSPTPIPVELRMWGDRRGSHKVPGKRMGLGVSPGAGQRAL